jgi:hypothetical protein
MNTLPPTGGADEMFTPEGVVSLGPSPKPETPPVPELHHGALHQLANAFVYKWLLPLLILLGGAAVAALGVLNGALSDDWLPEPDRTTLAELPDRGQGANRHVIVSEARAVPSEAITLVRKVIDYETGQVTRIPEAYIVPLQPEGGQVPDQRGFFLLLVSARDKARLNAALARTEHQGTVYLGVSDIESEQANLIRLSFPQAANSQVYLLVEGDAPWDRRLTLAFFAAGCLIAIGGLALGVMRTLSRTD